MHNITTIDVKLYNLCGLCLWLIIIESFMPSSADIASLQKTKVTVSKRQSDYSESEN